jgi:hypothetical protein
MPKKRKPYRSVSGRTAHDIVPGLKIEKDFWHKLKGDIKKK